jgi:hypothetical protein
LAAHALNCSMGTQDNATRRATMATAYAKWSKMRWRHFMALSFY